MLSRHFWFQHTNTICLLEKKMVFLKDHKKSYIWVYFLFFVGIKGFRLHLYISPYAIHSCSSYVWPWKHEKKRSSFCKDKPCIKRSMLSGQTTSSLLVLCLCINLHYLMVSNLIMSYRVTDRSGFPHPSVGWPSPSASIGSCKISLFYWISC